MKRTGGTVHKTSCVCLPHPTWFCHSLLCKIHGSEGFVRWSDRCSLCKQWLQHVQRNYCIWNGRSVEGGTKEGEVGWRPVTTVEGRSCRALTGKVGRKEWPWDSYMPAYKVNPCTGLDRPWGFREDEAPGSSTFGIWRWQGPPPPPRRRYPWYLHLLQTESTPRPYCSRKDKPMKNPSDPIGNLTRDLPTCSAVPHKQLWISNVW